MASPQTSLDHVHYWTPTFGGQREICHCGLEQVVGGTEPVLQYRWEKVWTGTTQVVAECYGCGKAVFKGEGRTKWWHPGLTPKRKSRNGPGVWTHVTCQP